MQTLLVFSETLFFLVVSVAVIMVGALCVIAAYHLMRITKELEGIYRDVHDASSGTKERIKDIIERLSGLPILSFFLKKGGAKESSHE